MTKQRTIGGLCVAICMEPRYTVPYQIPSLSLIYLLLTAKRTINRFIVMIQMGFVNAL